MLRGDGRVGRQEAARLSPSRKVVRTMARKSKPKGQVLIPSERDQIEGILALTEEATEEVARVGADLEMIQRLAQDLLERLPD